MNLVLIVLALLGGFASFLSPCAFPLLPVYIVYWIGGGSGGSLKAGLKSGLAVILGIETILVAFILLPGFLVERFISAIPLVGCAVGLLLAALGTLTIISSKVTIPIHLGFRGSIRLGKPYVQQYLYGVVYAFNSLACVFPILLMILASPLAGGEPLLLFLTFSAGMTSPMLLLIVLLNVLGDALVKRLRRVLPYIRWVEGIIALSAGLYLIVANI